MSRLQNYGYLSLAFFMLVAGIGIGWALHDRPGGEAHQAKPAETLPPERRVLYWYDPMQPQQHFDKPGPSPFMDMDLIPKYADEAGEQSAPALTVDAAVSQNIAVRLAKVTKISVSRRIDASGLIAFNERRLAVAQTRSGGFVERVWPLAAGDVVAAGQPLLELLVPDWASAQQEFLALRELGDESLLLAARERLRLLGMPKAMIEQLARSGRVQNRYTVAAPIAGAIQALEVRAGMTVAAGQTVARINGLSSVWLEVAVAEAQASSLQTGDQALIGLTAFPGREFHGRVFEILPMLIPGSRSTRVRIELDNPGLALRPGQSAQVLLTAASRESGLVVPTEAVIRSGKRSLVMLASGQGRYRPQEVVLGGEIGNQTVVTAGLEEGQDIVASGQFLLDSEASLNAIAPREADAEAMADHRQQVGGK